MCLAHEYILQKQVILPKTQSKDTLEEESLETSENEIWTIIDYRISVAWLSMLQGHYETAEKHLVWATNKNILVRKEWCGSKKTKLAIKVFIK